MCDFIIIKSHIILYLINFIIFWPPDDAEDASSVGQNKPKITMITSNLT